jgi:hypothetical protein
VAALSVLATGCGAGQDASHAADRGTVHGPAAHTSSAASAHASTPGSSARGAPDARLTRAQALAFARAVNLKAADVPDAHGVRRRREKSEGAEVSHCEHGAAGGPKVAQVASPKLVRGSELEKEEIASGVTVRPDAQATMREVSLLRSRSTRECVARAFTRRFAGMRVGEAHYGRFSISLLPVQAPGADAAVAWRIQTSVNFTLSEVSVPIYIDVLGFTDGPAEVYLSAISATQPVPSATEQRLLSLLLSRAQAHPL